MLIASGSALSANRLLSIALPWFVLTTTGSATSTGLVVCAQLAPYVLSQALSGPIIDRFGPRQISIVGDLISMSAMVVAPLLYFSGWLQLWVLMLLMAIVGTADGPANAAKSVVVPAATRAARVPLERGTGLSGAVERTAGAVGPAIAGVVLSTVGNMYTLWAAAALFGLACAVATLTLPRQPPTDRVGTVPAGYLAQLREGFDFLRNEPLLRAIAMVVAVTNLLDQAFMSVLLPLWAQSSGLGVDVVGRCISIFAATSIAAALAAAAIGNRLPRRLVYLVGFVIGGVPRFAAMALGLPVWAVLGVFAVGGLGSGFINPIIGAVSYERIPDALLGRVKTMTSALAWVGIPFGGLLGAGLVAVAGINGALWILGTCYLVVIIVPGLRKERSQLRPEDQTPDDGPMLVLATAAITTGQDGRMPLPAARATG